MDTVQENYRTIENLWATRLTRLENKMEYRFHTIERQAADFKRELEGLRAKAKIAQLEALRIETTRWYRHLEEHLEAEIVSLRVDLNILRRSSPGTRTNKIDAHDAGVVEQDDGIGEKDGTVEGDGKSAGDEEVEHVDNDDSAGMPPEVVAALLSYLFYLVTFLKSCYF